MSEMQLCVYPPSCSCLFVRFAACEIHACDIQSCVPSVPDFAIHALVGIDLVSIIMLAPLRSFPVNINPVPIVFLNLTAPCLCAPIVVSVSVSVGRAGGAAAAGAPRPIRTQVSRGTG